MITLKKFSETPEILFVVDQSEKSYNVDVSTVKIAVNTVKLMLTTWNHKIVDFCTVSISIEVVYGLMKMARSTEVCSVFMAFLLCFRINIFRL